MIMIEVKSVMLFSVGMYLPLGTTFAIFVGGVIRWVTDKLRDRRGFNDAQKARVDDCGVLTASGLIAGEALCGLAVAAIIARRLAHDPHADTTLYQLAIGNFPITSILALWGTPPCHDTFARLSYVLLCQPIPRSRACAFRGEACSQPAGVWTDRFCRLLGSLVLYLHSIPLKLPFFSTLW